MFVLLFYILAGAVINYSTIFIIWGIYGHYCKGNDGKYWRIRNKCIRENGIDVFSYYHGWQRILLVYLLWPINVYNTLVIGLAAIKEAKEEE